MNTAILSNVAGLNVPDIHFGHLLIEFVISTHMVVRVESSGTPGMAFIAPLPIGAIDKPDCFFVFAVVTSHKLVILK